MRSKNSLQLFVPYDGVAVRAAIECAVPVDDLEDLRKLLLGRADAARVLAGEYVREGLRQAQCLLLHTRTVLDVVYGDT